MEFKPFQTVKNVFNVLKGAVQSVVSKAADFFRGIISAPQKTPPPSKPTTIVSGEPKSIPKSPLDISPLPRETAKSTVPVITKTTKTDNLISGALSWLEGFLGGIKSKPSTLSASLLETITPSTPSRPAPSTILKSPLDITLPSTETAKSTVPTYTKKETLKPEESTKPKINIFVDPSLKSGFTSKGSVFVPPKDVENVERYYRSLGYEPIIKSGKAPPYVTTTYTRKEIPPPSTFEITPKTTDKEPLVGVMPPTETEPILYPKPYDVSGLLEQIYGNLYKEGLLPQFNLPEGVAGYIYKDPLGGSSYVFDYTIKPGDTLEKIASTFGVSIEELKKLNQDKKSIKGVLMEGETLRIPIKYKEPEFNELIQQLIQSGLTTDQINRLQNQLYNYWVSKILPDRIVDDTVAYLFNEEMRRLNDLLDAYNRHTSVESYKSIYQNLLNEYGIPADYQRLFDLQRIMQKTREDVLREAQLAGGIVTESQVEAVVNFRLGILKQEAETLSEIIDMKERMVDKMMKYVEMDREELNRRLEKALNIEERLFKLKMDAVKWQYDYMQDLMNKNKKKVDAFAEAGILHTFSPYYLSTFANPYHTNYSGYSPEELVALYQLSIEIERDKMYKRQQIEENIRKTIESLELARQRLELQQMRAQIQRGLTEKRLKLQEKGLELREKELELKEKELERKLGTSSLFSIEFFQK